MARTYIPSLYRTNAAQTPEPLEYAAEALITLADECTKRLRESPYDPVIWTERAGYFLALNYPELAVGDAYKAGLLFDRASSQEKQGLTGSGEDGATSQKYAEARLRAYGIMGQALYDCHCHLEAAEFWEDVAKKVGSPTARTKVAELRALLKQKEEAAAAAGLKGTPQEQEDRLKDGGVVSVYYPWMEVRHRRRSPETIAGVNQELANMEPQSCYWAPSTLSDKKDMLGMFAARDIEPGEYILIDRTTTGACSNSEGFICENCFGRVKCPPIQAPCCSEISTDGDHMSRDVNMGKYFVYCSTACFNLAHGTFHKALCGKNLDWLLDPAKGLEVNASPMRPLLMLRFLAACVQAGPDTHPLDHPLIARLQPLANCEHVDVFTLHESVATPIKILQQLGVDVFANPNFDTMILHTLWTRIANNKVGSSDPKRGFIDAINPFLPLFNHSCEPNVVYKREDSSTTMKFFSTKAIKKDEEMFDGYLDVQDMPLGRREELLWPWFEGPCLCKKCKKDRAMLEALRPPGRRSDKPWER